MVKSADGQPRGRGGIERRGNSLRVKVFTGRDPLTGKRMYVTESTTDPAEAQKILTRLRNRVDEQRHARTNGSLRTIMESWFSAAELEDSTRNSYRVYIDRYIYPALGNEPIGRVTARVLEHFYADLRRCRQGCNGTPFTEHRVDGPHECRSVKHRRPPGRKPIGGYPAHDCTATGCTVIECQPHRCEPLSNATILKIHYILSGTFTAAMRWDWITSNPAEVAKKPRQPVPEPDPPTAEQAGRVVSAAWEQDSMWGTLVWLVMVTGLRRAELLGLRWNCVDLDAGKLTIRRTYVGGTLKDTKTHRSRRLAIDAATVEILTEHRQRYHNRMSELGIEASDDAYLFSAEPTCGRPYSPSWVSRRYTKMCAALGIESHLHALRHYAATELLAAGIDLRAVAGRLGHGSGGATTLQVYAAWVDESDRRAANVLGSRIERPGRASN